jgi:hypothetical protein
MLEGIKAYLKIGTFIAVTVFAIAGIGWVMKPVDKMVERQVLVNSHQYIEGRSAQANIYEATIAQIDSNIAAGIGNRDSLLAQKAGIQIRLNALKN